MEKNTIEKRVRPLTEDTQAHYGIMTAQHMIEHLTITVKLSYGRIKLPEFEPTEKQLAQKHSLLYTDMDFPKGIIAPGIGEKLLELRYLDLVAAISELLKSIDSYNRYFSEFPKEETVHPRFGKLNHDEWERFHRKHFNHHLTQFGI